MNHTFVVCKYIDFQEDENPQQEVSRMKGFGMSIYYDGIEDGKMEERVAIVKTMHEDGMHIEQIAKYVQMTVEEVQKLLRNSCEQR